MRLREIKYFRRIQEFYQGVSVISDGLKGFECRFRSSQEDTGSLRGREEVFQYNLRVV